MKKVLIAINFDEGLYNFRKELIEALIEASYEVHIVLPDGEYISRLQQMGCIFHETAFRRRGKNPMEECRLIARYSRILREVRPDVVLTYTIKPNLYVGMLCGMRRIPYITTITGLGTAVEGTGLLQKLTQAMYRMAMRKAAVVFFQNTANEKLFTDRRIAPGKHRMLPGSGVNLEHFCYQEFPAEGPTEFLFISRVMKEKGIEQYLDAAEAVRKRYPDTVFRILGFLEEDYEGTERFRRMTEQGVVRFEGSVEDVVPYIRNSQCTVHPSFYPEGMSNVCLESAACGRAVITTDRAGCRETVKDGETGFLVKERDSADLTEKILQFLEMPAKEREQMGRRGRAYMESCFDRRIVVKHYLDAVAELTMQQ